MTAAFVVDASVAFAWILPNQASPEAQTLLERIETGTVAAVPSLWFLQVANGLLVAQRRKRVTAPERTLALKRLSALALTVDEDDASEVFGRTFTLAEQFDLSVYDAVYLELALRRNLPLVTRGRALRSAANRSGLPRFV